MSRRPRDSNVAGIPSRTTRRTNRPAQAGSMSLRGSLSKKSRLSTASPPSSWRVEVASAQPTGRSFHCTDQATGISRWPAA